jgi:hypothetical protein
MKDEMLELLQHQLAEVSHTQILVSLFQLPGRLLT